MFPLGTLVHPSTLGMELVLGYKHYGKQGKVVENRGQIVVVAWDDESLPRELGVEMVEKDPDAQRMRKRRDEKLSPQERSELAKRAARARWGKVREREALEGEVVVELDELGKRFPPGKGGPEDPGEDPNV